MKSTSFSWTKIYKFIRVAGIKIIYLYYIELQSDLDSFEERIFFFHFSSVVKTLKCQGRKKKENWANLYWVVGSLYSLCLGVAMKKYKKLFLYFLTKIKSFEILFWWKKVILNWKSYFILFFFLENTRKKKDQRGQSF